MIKDLSGKSPLYVYRIKYTDTYFNEKDEVVIASSAVHAAELVDGEATDIRRGDLVAKIQKE